MIGDNVSTTEHKRILKAQEEHLPYEILTGLMEQLEKAEGEGDVEALKNILKDAVSGFSPEKQIVDIIYLQKTLN